MLDEACALGKMSPGTIHCAMAMFLTSRVKPRRRQGRPVAARKLAAKIDRTSLIRSDDELTVKLAWQTEPQAQGLARDIRKLAQWLSHDVLTLTGPTLATRQCCSTLSPLLNHAPRFHVGRHRGRTVATSYVGSGWWADTKSWALPNFYHE